MNSSLTTLVNNVYSLTNRPDLVSETLLAVQNATLKAHRSDFYPKDLLETGIQFDSPNTLQTLAYKTIVPSWKALKYLRKYDYSSPPGIALDFLKIVAPDNVLDDYNLNVDDVCYVAGLNLQIRTKQAMQYFLLGCYVNPIVTAQGYASWIADEQPACILYDAAATIFKTIGFDEQNAAYRQMVLDEYVILKENNILANGY